MVELSIWNASATSATAIGLKATCLLVRSRDGTGLSALPAKVFFCKEGRTAAVVLLLSIMQQKKYCSVSLWVLGFRS